ncbi:MAG: thermonuclease family protein [Pseudomonadota bacterium]
MGVSFIVVYLVAKNANATNCVSTHFHEEVSIKSVIDGDTVIIDDDRHVRLIGIDTPEIFHDGRVAEPMAYAAKQFLASLIQDNATVKLHFDIESMDKYKRTLAHLYLPNGENIQASLLASGLAVPLIIPPNLAHVDCYAEVSAKARQQQIGLWSLATNQSVHVAKLTAEDKGFRVINGKVKRVSASRSAIWINMEHNVALRILRSDLDYFNMKQIETLPGRHIEAKGKLYFRNQQHRIRIRYPLDFTIIDIQ